jgi:hypothetical protein
MASAYPVRAVQRNLHHQLLRSVLITGSSRRAGKHLRDRHLARHDARGAMATLCAKRTSAPRDGEVLK